MRSPSRARWARTLTAGIGAIVLVAATAGAGAAVNTNQTGRHNGYFYSYWKDSGSVELTLGPGGNYAVGWHDVNWFVVGKGWDPGRRRTIRYSGTFNPDGNAWVGVYGWTRSPLVEYTIVDSWGSWRPPGGQSLGTVASDGGIYDLYRTQHVNSPSIDGIATFSQYWSVRQTKRVGGTVTIGNHFDAWSRLGLNLGTHSYQLLAVEGYQSSGNANLTVAERLGP